MCQAQCNFLAVLSAGRSRGNLTYHDEGAAIFISKAKVRSVTFTSNSADFSGTADFGGGNRVTFDVSVTDNGAGSSDTFFITLSNGYSAGGNLTEGDIEIR